MSIFSMVFASMHLSHALNRGVHHLERSETSRRRPSIDVRLVYQVDVLGILATAAITGSCSFQRDKSRNGAWFRSVGGPACSKTVSVVPGQAPALTVVGRATGTP